MFCCWNASSIFLFVIGLIYCCVFGLDMVPDSCLNCLALNHYNKNSCELHDTIARTPSGKENLVCGVYKLSPDYFTDCNSPGTGFNAATLGSEFTDHQSCAKDYNCARQCVKGFMRKYSSQCNGGGNLICADYGRLHAGGPNGCLKSNHRNSEPTLQAMVEQCGCQAVYEDENYCALQEMGMTSTLSPTCLATVIAVPIACFVVLVTVVVVILLLCLTKRSKRSVTTRNPARRFDSLERNLDGTYNKPPTQPHLYGEIPPSLLANLSPQQATRTDSIEHQPTLTFTAQDGSISTLDLRDIAVSSEPTEQENRKKSVVSDQPENSKDNRGSKSVVVGVYAEKVTMKKSHDYVNFNSLEKDEKPSSAYENCALGYEDVETPNDSQLPSSSIRAPIPVPRQSSDNAISAD